MRRFKFCLGIILILILVGMSGRRTTAVYTPETLDIGMSNNAEIGYNTAAQTGNRYLNQYLSGGVTGSGWATWNSNGDFAYYYIRDISQRDMVPVLTYYNILQSSPANQQNDSEQDRVRQNLASRSIMTSYWDDVALFFAKAAQFPNATVVVHVEPDMWGFMHKMTSGDDASQYPHTVYVGGTGIDALAGLPDTPQGYAQAWFALRTAAQADHVQIAYHHSRWGTDSDYAYSNPDNATLLSYANRSAQFYNSLGQEFDLTFAEVRDRDAGFYQFIYGDQGAAWWNETDYSNQITYFGRFNERTGQNIMLWQVPFGNTVKSEVNNSWERYQDNAVQTLIGESDYTTLKAYREAGLIGIIFGGGAFGVTQPYTDGGYYYEQLARYYSNGALALESPEAAATIEVTTTYSGHPGEGATFSWTTDLEGVTEYEIWSDDTADFTVGTDCAAASNCQSNGTATSFSPATPASGTVIYYKIVAVAGDQRVVSNSVLTFSFAERIYLPWSQK